MHSEENVYVHNGMLLPQEEKKKKTHRAEDKCHSQPRRGPYTLSYYVKYVRT